MTPARTTTATPAVAAVDLGATSGRVITGRIVGGRLEMKHVNRFPNNPVRFTEGDGLGLHWNIESLYASIEEGLRQALHAEDIRSIGIDSWAVDYGMLRSNRLLGLPYHYRDTRTGTGVEAVHATVPADELYARNGLQHLDFNTLFQLAVDRDSGFLGLAEDVLMIPDLVAYWLTGAKRTEATNASTTGLFSVAGQDWDAELMERLGFAPSLFAPLVNPGEHVGNLTEIVAARLGRPGESIPVTAVGSHDTASAIVGVPFETENSAYISSGTWSLVGLELPEPITTEAAREANFTNEGGVDGRVRFLKNVSGLWLLSESMRTWDRLSTDAQRSSDLQTLLNEAAEVDREVPVFDPSDPRFEAPGDMPERIRQWCVEHGQRPPVARAEVVRSILESLAQAYCTTIATAEELSGRTVDTIHVVGGGSQNRLLCRLTANRSGKKVVAGPVEATAMGNLLIQARAAGLVPEDSSLDDLRDIVRASFEVTEYLPE